MSIKPRKNCKCDRCNCDALKHAAFGLPIADALKDGGRISKIPYITDHLDLCDKHLNEANVSYVYYAESALRSSSFANANAGN
jgi:hypothetical protein